MALYRCGGGGGGTPILIQKNITENGTYYALNDNVDGYSSVFVDVGGITCAVKTQAEWNDLSYDQKRALGLTIIKNNISQLVGTWYDMSNSVVDIIKDFFNYVTENISMQTYTQQTIPHLIYFQGRWREGNSWDSTVISHSNLTYDSVDTGTIDTNYSGFNNKLVSILHDVIIGNNASITIRNGYSGVTDGGGVVAIPFDCTTELIGEHYGSNTDTITTDKKYDYVLFMSNKWTYSGSGSNGVYTIDGGLLCQTGDQQLIYPGSAPYTIALYNNVPSGTTITLGCGKTNVDDSVIAIGMIRTTSEYLPSSERVICDAYIDNFDATSHYWGNGASPFTLSETLTANADGIGIDIFGRPDASKGHPNVEFVYSDLGDINTDFTAYIVCRYSTDFAYSAIIGASYQESPGNCAYIIEEGITNVAGVCGGSSVVGSAHTANAYIVLAIRNNNKTISFFKNGVKGTDRIATNVGRYVTLTTPYPNGTDYCTQITVAYAGVVKKAESDNVVQSNIEALMTRFNIS